MTLRNKNRISGIGNNLSVIAIMVALIAAIALVVCRLIDHHDYVEKWKDYDDCGLA